MQDSTHGDDPGVVVPNGDDRPLSDWIDEVDEAARLNPRRVTQVRRLAGVGGAVVSAIGLVGLVAIFTGSRLVAGFGQVDRTIAPSTALAFVVLGIGIVLPVIRDHRDSRRVAIACGSFVTAIAAVHLVGIAPDLGALGVEETTSSP